MWCLDPDLICTLLTLLPFALVFVGVLIAVFGKAYRNFPYQPDENKVFKKYALPRSHLFCFRYFDERRPAPKPRARLKDNHRRA